MSTLIKTDIWILKWKFVYLVLFNILSIFLFWKKFIFLSFFFLESGLDYFNQGDIFNFLILYNLTSLVEKWFVFSSIFYYFFIFNFVFFLIIFKTSLYEIENRYILVFFIKINFLYFLIQFLFYTFFNWFIYLLEERFIEKFFRIEFIDFSLLLENKIYLVCFFLFIICFLALILNLENKTLNLKYKIILLNLLFITYLFLNLLYIQKILTLIFISIFFFFIRYLIFFCWNI